MEKDRVILGENCTYSTDSDVTGLNNNVVVCGGSGSGKTMSISEAKLLETKNTSLIVTVTKRRIVEKYTPLFIERGYEVYDLNFADPAKSNIAFDPLAYVKSYSDIIFLAKAIVKADPNKDKSNADPYWDEASISLLCAEIAYVKMTKKNATLTDVLNLHSSLKIEEGFGTITTTLDSKFERIEQEAPDCFAISCWKSFRNLPIKTAGCVYGTLNTTIDTIFSPELKEMIATQKTVNFRKMGTKKTVLFVTSSAVNPALHCFVNMFYGQGFKDLFEFAETLPDGALPVPVHALCDDFATGSRILNFPEYISIFREKNISVTLLLQSESQLEQMYGDGNAVTIINNCDSYIYLGGMDLSTARNVSVRLNVPLDEVLYMPIGQEVLFRRGQRPIVTQRYNIKSNDLYQKVTDEYNKRIADRGR